MDLKYGRPALETLLMAYNLALAGVWILRASREAVTPLMVFLHVVLALVFLRMPRFRPGAGAMTGFLRRVYPFVFWVLAWSEIGWLFDPTSPLVHDQVIRTADLALFGIHLNQVLAGVLDWRWLRDLMGFLYLSYYLLILVPPLVLGQGKRFRQLEFHTFGLLSTYVACFLIYLVMPVLGPRDLALAAGEAHAGTGGLFGGIMNAFFAAGDSLGTAFPSSHCAGSVASALLVGRHFHRGAGRVAAVWAGLIVVSTVYTNNHYAIDAVAGIALAVGTVTLAARLRPGRSDVSPAKIPGFTAGYPKVAGRRESESKGGRS